jgi:hypothetical protein
MTNSVTTKRAVILNAIAITTALAVISGYSPLHQLPLNQVQSLLQSNPLFNPAPGR